MNDRHLEEVKTERLPDVVLVKKVYADKALRNRKRRWRLKRLADGAGSKGGGSTTGEEFMEFMEDLEENPEIRQFVNVYKRDRRTSESTVGGEGEEELPQIALAEMLDEMDLGGGGGVGGGGPGMEENGSDEGE